MATSDTRPQQAGDGLWDGYAPVGESPPLGSRLAMSSGFVAVFTAFLIARCRSGDELPERIDVRADVIAPTLTSAA